jgi:glyceraldehyde 3-phosphate dehydrogenase
MRLRTRHDILSALSAYGDTMREKNVGIFINAAGDIGLSCLTLGLECGLPIIGVNEPHKKVNPQVLAASLGAGHDPQVSAGDGVIYFGKQQIKLMQTFEPWKEPLQHDGPVLVLNCSGIGFNRATSQNFLNSWADGVILSGPPEDKDIPLALLGVTADAVITNENNLWSMASCTTNSAARAVLAIHDKFAVNGGTMETIHSATNSNGACDSWQLGSGILDAVASPGSSGALKLLGRLVKALDGRFDGGAMRVAVADGSITSLTLHTSAQGVTVDAVNQILMSCAPTDDPHFGYNPKGNEAIDIGMVRKTHYLAWYDAPSTKVVSLGEHGTLIQVHIGYSNKWGFAFGMLGLAAKWALVQ